MSQTTRPAHVRRRLDAPATRRPGATRSSSIFFLSGLGSRPGSRACPACATRSSLHPAQIGLLIFGHLGRLDPRPRRIRPHRRAGSAPPAAWSSCLVVVAVGLVVVGIGATVGPDFVAVFAGLAVFGFGNGIVRRDDERRGRGHRARDRPQRSCRSCTPSSASARWSAPASAPLAEALHCPIVACTSRSSPCSSWSAVALCRCDSCSPSTSSNATTPEAATPRRPRRGPGASACACGAIRAPC